MAEIPFDEVGALLWEAAERAVLPRFRRLDEADVSEKSPGEVVTAADYEAERIITAGLRRLLPGSVVVGEEAVAADTDLLGHLGADGDVWLVDPVDGTANFAAGRWPFALMVALLRGGALAGAWILDPLAGDLAMTGADGDCRLNGVPVRLPTDPRPAGELRGAVMTRFLPPSLGEAVRVGASRIGELLDGQHCAAREYLDLLTGVQQFALFWQALPWDHAAGALLLRRAGGIARWFDGSDYHPSRRAAGLLVAANERIWETVRGILLTP